MLRKLHKKDLPRLISIEETIQSVPWSEEVFEQCFRTGYPGWVLEENKKIIGFVLASIQTEECHILNVGVDRAYQRKGFGRQLMEHALLQARLLGARIAYLEVRESNSKAIRLYQNLGFIQIGVRKDYYPVPTGRESALVFAKDISVRLK